MLLILLRDGCELHLVTTICDNKRTQVQSFWVSLKPRFGPTTADENAASGYMTSGVVADAVWQNKDATRVRNDAEWPQMRQNQQRANDLTTVLFVNKENHYTGWSDRCVCNSQACLARGAVEGCAAKHSRRGDGCVPEFDLIQPWFD
eukprot:5714162-Amphidinium_carterae.1